MFSSDKFLIVKYMKQFILSLDEIVINYPNKEMVIKNRLHSDSLDILEYIYQANIEEELDKKKYYQNKILSKISMLDLYLEKSYKKKYIVTSFKNGIPMEKCKRTRCIIGYYMFMKMRFLKIRKIKGKYTNLKKIKCKILNIFIRHCKVLIIMVEGIIYF